MPCVTLRGDKSDKCSHNVLSKGSLRGMSKHPTFALLHTFSLLRIVGYLMLQF